MRASTEGAEELDCPICEGRGQVPGTDYVEHIAVPSGRDCDICGGSGKLPILPRELLFK